MVAKNTQWKKGRGKLGALVPLLGEWMAESDSPMGRVLCTRTFRPVLSSAYVEMNARWQFATSAYEEIAVYGFHDGKLSFWSFTSDGKRSQGTLADGKDVHPQAICFQAKMPAGMARMIYWPDPEEGFHWAVEAKSKKGWKRFTEHHYTPARGPA